MSVRLNADPHILRTAGNRFCGRKARSLRRFLSATLVATGVGIPASASADTVDIKVKNVTGPTLKVTQDGEDYTDLSGSYADIVVDLQVKLHAGTSGKVKFWSVWPNLNGQDFKALAKSKSYAVGDRPKNVDRLETFSIKQADYAKVAIDACNAHAKSLRLAGKSNAEIFGSQHTLWINVAAGWQYDMTGVTGVKPPTEVTLNPEIEVFCKKAAPLSVGLPATHTPVVKTVSLEVSTQTSITGECKLQLFGNIETNQANRLVKFRYVDGEGKKSDVKSARTGSTKTIAFNHDYDLTKNSGQVSGKVRMEGVGTDFVSDWAQYQGNCNGATVAEDLITVLPPTAKILAITAMDEIVVGERYVCPSRVRYRGVVEGRGPAKGATAMLAGNSLAELKFHELEKGDKQYIQTFHELDWKPGLIAQNENAQTVKFKMNVTNALNKVVASDSKTGTYKCKPVIQSASVTATVTKKAIVNGAYFCPVKYKIGGSVKANSDVVVKAVLREEVQNVASIPLSLKRGKNRTLMPVERDLSWKGVTQTPNGLVQQVLLQVTVMGGSGNLKLAHAKKNEFFQCSKIAGVGLSSSSGGTESAGQVPKSHQPKQAMVGAKALQQAPGFQVLAPKGVVSKGEVRLSGGKASGKYKLTFYRKAGAGYKAVKASGLPRKMTGTIANFKLGALKGGTDFRLEVCPAGTRNKKLCKTSNFRLPAFKGMKTLKKQ